MRLGVCQLAPVFGDAVANAKTICDWIAEYDADLLIFPEAAVTGYCFRNYDEAVQFSVNADSAPITSIIEACRNERKHAVVGFAEAKDGRLYNSALFASPHGVIGIYRKTHLPHLGLDRYVHPGKELPLYETPFGSIGILICFDIRVPEAARTLALAGADLICVPTNWPEGAEPSAEIISPARALENHVFVAAANRVGVENGFRFVGLSKIISPKGEVIASLDGQEVKCAVADVDLSSARQKRVVKIPGEYELDLFGQRKPGLYSNLLSQR